MSDTQQTVSSGPLRYCLKLINHLLSQGTEVDGYGRKFFKSFVLSRISHFHENKVWCVQLYNCLQFKLLIVSVYISGNLKLCAHGNLATG